MGRGGTLQASLEDRIQREIRRRAFERADTDARIREQTQFTLAALQEVTGLSAAQLQDIATEVRGRYDQGLDRFFSIRSQVLILLAASAMMGLAAALWAAAY
jgi:hypothetical protein